MLNFIRTLIRCRNPHEQWDKLKFHGRNTIGCSCTIVRVIHFTKILMHVWADPSSESKTQKILPPVALPESCCKSNLPWITSRFSELLSDITEFGREHAMLPGITEFGGEHEERCQHTHFGLEIWIKNEVFFLKLKCYQILQNLTENMRKDGNISISDEKYEAFKSIFSVNNVNDKKSPTSNRIMQPSLNW